MEYKKCVKEDEPLLKSEPRLIIHGGAGNIPSRDEMPAETYAAYRHALLTIVCHQPALLVFSFAIIR